MINIIIYSALGFSLFYFLIRNRVDFLLLFFLSLTLYHWQIIGGEIILPPYRFEVSSNSKLIVSLVYIIHTFITILHDYLYKNKKAVAGMSVMKKIDYEDEWLAEAYMETDYNNLRIVDFKNTIRNYFSYIIKDGEYNA